MPELSTAFIISQVLMFFAMGTDFLSMQFKNRKYIFLALIASAVLISTHYFLLDKTAAGIIVTISVLRFITCYFTTDKKYLYIFLILNVIAIVTTYSEIRDLMFFVWVSIFIVWNFQANDKFMRKIMMLWTAIIMIYNILIFSPMGAVAEWAFLVSHILGYYRYYFKRWKKKNICSSC